jgi:hypothetical protein
MNTSTSESRTRGCSESPGRLLQLSLAGLVLFATGVPGYSQETRGEILGRVADPSGAVIVGAKARAVNLETNVQTSTETNQAGDYRLPFLVSGTYRVSVEADSFKTFVQEGITVQVNSKVTVNVSLQMGATSETVKVVGEAPLVDSASASLGGVIEPRQISDLPLKDGNPIMVASLTPGVTMIMTGGQSRPFDNSSVSQISINGVRRAFNEFTMDGAPDTGGQNGNFAYAPPAAAVDEFKIQTASFDATSGYSPGAVVNMSIKSGTNTVHGELHEFVQNTVFNANSFFSNKAGRVRDPWRANRWGGMVSGPVWIPKLYNGVNRTFFMYSYEGLQSVTYNGIINQSIPTAKMQQGDLSELLKVGNSYQIYDPATIQAAANGRTTRLPFANNVIPSSRIDPVAPKLLALMPTPNLPGTADASNNFTRPDLATDKYYNHLFRIDQNFSEKHRIFFRGNYNRRTDLAYHEFNGANGQDSIRQNQGLALDDVYVINPQFLLNFRYSLTRYYEPYVATSAGWDLIKTGFSQQFVNQINGIDPHNLMLPHIMVSGVPEYSPYKNRFTGDVIHDFAGSATRTLGSHTLRFGGEVRVYQDVKNDPGFAAGQLSYSSTWTVGPYDNSASAPTGQGLASFLLGLPSSGSIDYNDTYAQQAIVPSLFVQDDWKITSRLTLTLGVRNEMNGATTERFNRTVRGFDGVTALPIQSTVQASYAASPITEVAASQFLVRGGLTFAGINGQPRSLWNSDNVNLAPRVGLAYRLDSRTALRAGYGVFSDLERQTVNQTGFSQTTTLVPSIDNGLTFISSTGNPFPTGWAKPVGTANGLMTNVGSSVSFFNSDLLVPYMQRWQASVQRELPSKSVFEVTYVGNRGTRILTTRNLDAVPGKYYSTLPTRDQTTINYLGQAVNNPYYPLLPGTSLASKTVSRTQLLRPYTQFTGMSYSTNEGYSWYHSLQTRFEKRMSAGYTFLASWTWSKFMEATGFLNEFDTRPERVISNQDRTHRLVVSGIYELPFGKGRSYLNNAPAAANKLIEGWQIQGIYQGQSGVALGFGNSIFTGDLANIPFPNGQRTPDRWFNIDAGFERTSSKQLGSNVRTMPTRFTGVRGDGINNWDLSVFKSTGIREKIQVEFRAEFINAFNHTQFSTPNTSPTSSAFGTITGISQLPRIVQLAMRAKF